MPQYTFLNLAPEKRKRIIEISLEEFAHHDFESASVSRIVKKIGVAKGSFYRYFRNKLDLYTYLVDTTTKLRLDTVEELFQQTEGFFDLLTQDFYMRIKFDIEYPLHGKFLYNIMQERHSKDLGNMMLKTKRKMVEVISGMVKKFQAKGEVRQDIDTEIMAFQIIQTQFGINDYLSLYLKKLSAQEKRIMTLHDIPQEEIIRIIKSFVNILRQGMAELDMEPVAEETLLQKSHS
ncbi:MAG: TetR/AcrR family transcriptional regulator [Bacteroidota bacterium]